MMRRSIVFVLSVFIFSFFPCQAQADTDNLFSVDLSYTLTGLLNQGWGIGLNYEKKLTDYLSVKWNLGHMTFLTGIEDIYNTSVSLSLLVNYYPFGGGLDKLYIGAGNGCDFMNYFGSGKLPHTANDTLIHITPHIGWKLNILKFMMIDVSAGYKLIVDSTENYSDIKSYVNPGPRLGLNFSVFLNRLKKEGSDAYND